MVSRSDAVIVVSAWAAVTVVSALYLWRAPIDLWTNLMIILLFIAGLIITFGVLGMITPFSISEPKELRELSKRLDEIKSEIAGLKKSIEELRRIIEE